MARKPKVDIDEDAAASESQQTVDINLNIKQPKPPRAPAPPAPVIEFQPPPVYETEYEFDEEEFVDPLDEFLQRFRHLQGHYFNLARRPDPPDMQNGYFLRDCNTPQNYGRMAFNPLNLIPDIQRKLRSGGMVTITLVDVHSRFVNEGRITFTVGDPDPATVAHAHANNSSAPGAEGTTQAVVAVDPVDPLEATVRHFTLMKQLKEILKDDEPATTRRSAQDDLSSEQQLTLAVAKDAGLITNVMTSIVGAATAAAASAAAQSAGSAGGNDSAFDKTLRALEWTGIQSRLPNIAERVVNKYFPEAEEGGGADSAEESDALISYIADACVSNMPVTLDDAPFVEFRDANPGDYDELMGLLHTSTREQLITHFGYDGSSSLKLALKAPHAAAWFDNLKRIAAGAAWRTRPAARADRPQC